MADDAAAEAAFLDAMRLQNDAAGGQEVNGTASQQQADSVSDDDDDEYDPAVEIHAESFSTDAQAPAVSFSSSSAVKPISVSAPLEPYPSTATSGYDDAQVSDQSRSMSPDSTQSIEGTPSIITRTEGEGISGSYQQVAGTDDAKAEAGSLPNGQFHVQASPTAVSSSLPASLPQDSVSIQNDVQGVPSAETVQNSIAPSTPNVSASTTDAAITSPGKFKAQPLPTQALQSQMESKKEETSTATTTAPKARLPHDRVGILEDRIQADPRGDHDAWLSIISEHRQRGKLGDARKAYERFFEVFPAAVSSYFRSRN